MNHDPGNDIRAAAAASDRPAGAAPPCRAPVRLWAAWGLGVVLALAASWLLAILAFLPGELGLFFFLLLGLLIGAAMYRVGRPAAPLPRPQLLLAGLSVALVLWLSVLALEYRSLPELAFKVVRGTIKTPLAPEQRERMQTAIRLDIQAQLKLRYRPGGLIGYAQWAARSGQIVVPRVIDSSTVSFRLSQRRWRWITRVVLSLIFACGAILSQVLALGRNAPADEPPKTDEPGA